MREKINFFIFGFVVCLFICAVVAGLYYYRGDRRGDGAAGELDTRFSEEYGGASETVRRLEAALERERGINRELRENNSRAREIAFGIKGATEQDVRNLQEAVGLIRKVRARLKILADIYADSSPDSDGVRGLGWE